MLLHEKYITRQKTVQKAVSGRWGTVYRKNRNTLSSQENHYPDDIDRNIREITKSMGENDKQLCM